MIQQKKDGIRKIRREIEDKKWKDFGNPHLGVLDVNFNPENGSKMAQVAKSEI